MRTDGAVSGTDQCAWLAVEKAQIEIYLRRRSGEPFKGDKHTAVWLQRNEAIVINLARTLHHGLFSFAGAVVPFKSIFDER